MLRINNIYKNFANNLILNNLTIEVTKKSIVGLAGPSGSGKSTLLRCIQKLETIDAGTIQYDCLTGFMFQDFQLFPHMTVLDNIVYAPMLHNKSINYKIKAESLLESLGVLDKANEYPHRLSGGEKQRVALARSLIMHPKLLLCDEPTSGLDILTTLDVISLLKSIRDMDVTMIIASHDLNFLTKISDRIVILKNGNIIEDIDPNLLQDPIHYIKSHY